MDDWNKGLRKTEDFLKEAFCIDGECTKRSTGFDKLVSSNGEWCNVLTFKLTDSERGEFYVSIGADFTKDL